LAKRSHSHTLTLTNTPHTHQPIQQASVSVVPGGDRDTTRDDARTGDGVRTRHTARMLAKLLNTLSVHDSQHGKPPSARHAVGRCILTSIRRHLQLHVHAVPTAPGCSEGAARRRAFYLSLSKSVLATHVSTQATQSLCWPPHAPKPCGQTHGVRERADDGAGHHGTQRGVHLGLDPCLAAFVLNHQPRALVRRLCARVGRV